jgi:nitroreductase
VNGDAMLDAMRARRSIRRFRPGVVDDATVAAICEAAYRAPSGSADRGLWIVAVDDLEIRAAVRDRCRPMEQAFLQTCPEEERERILALPAYDPELAFLTDAPWLLVIANETSNRAYRHPTESAWASIAGLALAASAFGLGTFPYSPEILRLVGKRALHDLFDLPNEKRIQALMPIGHPDEAFTPPPAPDQSIDKVFRNRFGSS